MSLRIATAAPSGSAVFSKNNCPQCGEWPVAPNWSEYLDERCVRHRWSCEGCGHQFKTTVYFPNPSRMLRASEAGMLDR